MASCKEANGLTTLLFRLPSELRQMIYEEAVPSKNAVPWGYSHYSGWMAVSRDILLEAGALIYNDPDLKLTFNGDLLGPNMATQFQDHLVEIYGADAEWAGNIISSELIRRVTINMTRGASKRSFYVEDHHDDACSFATGVLQSFAVDFAAFTKGAAYLVRFRRMTDLTIVLRNPFVDENFILGKHIDETGDMGDSERELLQLIHPGMTVEEFISRSTYSASLAQALEQLRSSLPPGCRVEWRLPSRQTEGHPALKTFWHYSEDERVVQDFMKQIWGFVLNKNM